VNLRRLDLPARLPEHGHALIVRDEQMNEHVQNEGSVPMPDGESDLLLLFFPVGNDMHYLDLVTIDDPLENQFCWWAVEQIWDAYLSSKKEKQGMATAP
jgi:hypothetical protein